MPALNKAGITLCYLWQDYQGKAVFGTAVGQMTQQSASKFRVEIKGGDARYGKRYMLCKEGIEHGINPSRSPEKALFPEISFLVFIGFSAFHGGGGHKAYRAV